MDPLESIRDHVKGRGRIEVPDTLPCTDVDDSRYMRLQGSGIWLIITQYLDNGEVMLDIDLSDDDTDDLGALTLTCSRGKDGLVWSVVVGRSLPDHFRYFHDHIGDRGRADNLPHTKGVEWLDHLVQDFLSYTPG